MSQAIQKAPHERTREDFLALTEGDILDLRGKDLDAACARLCIDDATWSERNKCWIASDDWFSPSENLNDAALAYESMAKRGWDKLTVQKGRFWFAWMVDQSRDLGAVSPLMETEAEARTMACVLAAWKDGQYEK
jgi:hypothetical protein